MKGRQAILGHLNGMKIAALMVDGRLEDVFVPAQEPAAGAIYRGVVDRPMKGMGGAMVKLPRGTAFVRQGKGLAAGQTVTVQITTHAEPEKAAPATTRILFKSRYVIVTPEAPGLNISKRVRDDDTRDRLHMLAKTHMQGSPFGVILRSSCVAAKLEAIEDDLLTMRARAEDVMADDSTSPTLLLEADDPHIMAWREWTDTDAVLLGDTDLDDSGALDALEAAQHPRVDLRAGHMYIEPTRSLTAVDVNTSGGAGALEANLAALRALPRHLRLRGLGGQITIDLAPVMKRDRVALENTLRTALRTCPVETAFVGWTPLGHMELKRKRERAPVQRAWFG